MFQGTFSARLIFEDSEENEIGQDAPCCLWGHPGFDAVAYVGISDEIYMVSPTISWSRCWK